RSKVSVYINYIAEEEVLLVNYDLPIMHNLATILNLANSDYQLKTDWSQLEQSKVFNDFLHKITRIIGAKLTIENKNNVYDELTPIIIAMDQNTILRELCFKLSHEAIQAGGDHMAMIFAQMQLQVKSYSLQTILEGLFP
ncbi:MAG: NEL-type E3 ubiquitin ligase domain-containing protein, partial [Burkholderiales bacterium]